MPRLPAKLGARWLAMSLASMMALLTGCTSGNTSTLAPQTVTLHILDHDSERGIAEVEIIRERTSGGNALSGFLDPESRTIAQTDAYGVAVIHRADIDQNHQIKIEDLRHVPYVLVPRGRELIVLEAQPHPPTADAAEMAANGPLDPQYEEVDRVLISDGSNTQVTISMRTSSVLEEFFLAGILQAVAPQKLARLSDAEFEAQLPGIVDSLAGKYDTVRRERIETIVRDARHRAQSATRPGATRPAE